MKSPLISYEHFPGDPFKNWIPDDETKGAFEVLKWSYETFGDSIIYACSFGAEGIVLIDLISKVKKDAEIVFLDTSLHFKETYELIDRIKEKYRDLNIRIKKPKLTLEEQEEKYGPELWRKDPNLCCFIRKVRPLEEVLYGIPAWISGLRREQSPSRAKTDFVNKDERFHSIKVCPLIYWTWEDVWNYIDTNKLPYNPLHDQDYPSIGCAPCTAPVKEGEDLRSGRWQGFNKTECGLHISGRILK
ncbi:phosphoadenylyl-sulfate reductase [Pallidibacillus thermolactis]|jgi:phosphoadenosine phosphosulfate reductase|uniref:phosphoadenylyl-sulfate reductase n=1 Tax=Pallidibacillus thermolactis TaxID=251051 RepID=UPI002E20A501|nr:phosphoadenylyl-sulfate reductase [Pallidibacillus thermolactis]MED1674288.1 phosphoadenylyl-sulfate reductase [Pallidibacillus thermolactis subsp. kokeshiiformis]